MNGLLEFFLDRPMSHKVGIWIGTLAVVAGAWWMWLYSPVLEQHKELSTKIDDTKAQITYERRIARNLSRFKAEVKQLDERLTLALQELPDKREIPDLLSSVSDLARDAGLDVKLFKPLNESFREFYAEVPVSTSVTGTYHQVATFFDEVGQLARIVNIHSISMNEPKLPKDGGKAEVNAVCTATTFRYLDEDERQKKGKKKKKKGRRR